MWGVQSQSQEEQRARVAAKEAFVQGLTGSGVAEIVVMTTLPTVLSILYMAIESIVVRCGCRVGDWRVTIVLGLVEYGVMIVPEILQLTEAYDAFVMLGVVSVVAFVLMGKKREADKSEQPQQQGDMRPPPYTVALEDGGIKDAVSMHRAQVMLMTCVAILGVDFRAFPRRFAKTETYGTSLMDAGVGSIVLCSSFVQGVNQMKSPRYTAKRLKDSWSSLLRVVVLVVLGIGKPVVTTLMGYQVHVGEYGRHWNFFLTLAVLRAVIMNVPRSTSPLALGVTVAVAHQYGLSRFGLGEVVNSNVRGTSLLQQNKEGIISLPGYIALHFLGLWCAKVFVWMASLRARRHINTLILIFVGFLWTIYWVLAVYVEPASRRSCNTSFIAWMLAINVQAMLLNSVCLKYMRSHTDMGSRRYTVSTRSNASPYLPPLLNAVNRGMLYIFLAANVMTGVINSFVDTLSTGYIQTLRILAIYMAVIFVFTRTLFDNI